MEELLLLASLAGEALNKLTSETWGGFEMRNHILKKYHGQSEAVIIPEHVCGIAPDAFNRCSHVTSVKIPEHVTYIGNNAFFRCENLEKVNIPKSITLIDFMTFYKCYNLKSITIPEGVTSIGSSAFSDCIRLTSITIPESVEFIGRMAFWCCESLTELHIPDSVTSIGNGAFYKCKNLKSITLPKNLTSIADDVFDGCISLKSLTIPESVTTVGEMAFYRCVKLEELHLPENLVSIGSNAFYDCDSLKYLTLGKIRLHAEDAVYEQFELIRNKDYSVQINPEIKYDIIAQMYMYDIDTKGTYHFIQYRSIKMIKLMIQKNYTKAVEKILLADELITKENIDEFILYAIAQQSYEIQVLLMEYKTKQHWYDDMQTTIQKKFEL